MQNSMYPIYYLGGSPCSGKSTIAEMIAKQFGYYYFKVDDKLEEYLKRAQNDHKPICLKYKTMSPEEIWMRDPVIQNEDELAIYREMFEYIVEDLNSLSSKQTVITEGAAYLPELIKAHQVDANHYLSITPTYEFQYENYKVRPYVPYVLEGCSDKKQAFENWMKRDALFGDYVKEQAKELGFETIIVDGVKTKEEIFAMVCGRFLIESGTENQKE